MRGLIKSKAPKKLIYSSVSINKKRAVTVRVSSTSILTPLEVISLLEDNINSLRVINESGPSLEIIIGGKQ